MRLTRSVFAALAGLVATALGAFLASSAFGTTALGGWCAVSNCIRPGAEWLVVVGVALVVAGLVVEVLVIRASRA